MMSRLTRMGRDMTLRKDLHIKTPLYAQHGVAEVWIVDLENNRIRFHRSPKGGTYQDVTSASNPGTTPVPGLSDGGIDLGPLLMT